MHCSQSNDAGGSHTRQTKFLADALSRGKKMPEVKITEWSLNNTFFHQLGTPVVDLFATMKNKKLPVFCSPFEETTAVAIDA